jgi:peptidoglycan hydrolase-like protein with peptidoglycan-binding domain
MKRRCEPKGVLILAMITALFAGLAPNAFAQAAGRPDRLVTLPTSAAPPEAVMVISAIVLEMRGQPHPKGDWPEVVFAPAVAQRLMEPRFNYAGFRLLQVIVNDYTPSAQEPGRAGLKGQFHFLDALGRRTLVGFDTEYKATKNSIAVTRGDVKTICPAWPEVKLFVVPAERVTDEALQNFSNNAGMLDFVAKNALSPTQPELIPPGMRDYYAFAFFMDRLAFDDRTDLILCSTREGIDTNRVALKASKGIAGTESRVMRLDYNGWHVVIIRSQFPLTEDEMFLKAIFKPSLKDKQPGLGEPVLVGVFSTNIAQGPPESLIKKVQRGLAERGYNPGPADGSMGNSTRQAIEQFQRDQKLTVDGQPTNALLDILAAPGHPSAVLLAQLSLIQRGYNPGPADGSMGNRTRQAILKFQQDQGLAADGKLNAELLARMAGFVKRPVYPVTVVKPTAAGLGEPDATMMNRLKPKMWPNQIQRP